MLALLEGIVDDSSSCLDFVLTEREGAIIKPEEGTQRLHQLGVESASHGVVVVPAAIQEVVQPGINIGNTSCCDHEGR